MDNTAKSPVLVAASQPGGVRDDLASQTLGNHPKTSQDSNQPNSLIGMFERVAKLQEEVQQKQLLFKLEKDGVYYHASQQAPVWVCSPLKIVARTRDKEGNAHGRLLEWQDTDGRTHTWAMPMKLLSKEGDEYRKVFLDKGLEICVSQKARSLLAQYLQTTKPPQSVLCVDKTGWYEEAYVLSSQEVLGKTQEPIILQRDTYSANPFRKQGSLEDWQQHVAKYCVGNSRLIFAVSCAFAAPLLYWSSSESGGFHLRGASSIGKTTALLTAASVCGGLDYSQRWRTTANGLESTAVQFNDALLILDELSQVDPKQAGEIAYMLANGTGKQRATKDGSAKEKYTWRVLFLSTGEISLAEHMQTVGMPSKAGQTVRLVDIPADAGCGHGLFENLHGFNNAQELAVHLQKTTQEYYGTAFYHYLKAITQQVGNLHVTSFRNDFQRKVVPEYACGQVKRVAGRFALVAAGGELATLSGITGWNVGAATEVAKTCFKAWLIARGSYQTQETHQALSQIQFFFQRFGESRFTDWQEETARPTVNRAGFRKRTLEGTYEYFVFRDVFRQEICNGLDWRWVSKLSVEREWLLPDSEGNVTRNGRLPGIGQARYYHFSDKVLQN